MAEKGSTLKISQLSLKTSLSVLDNLQENQDLSKLYSDIVSYYREFSLPNSPEITPDNLFGLLRACNFLFLSPLYTEQKQFLCEITEFFANKVHFFPNEAFTKLFIAIFNNLAMVSLQLGHTMAARKYLKQCSSLLKNLDSKQMLALTLNNITALYLNEGLFSKACQTSEESLNAIEPFIFYILKSNNESNLKSNPGFMQELHILLTAYLNYAIALENMQKLPSNSKSHQKVLINGLKISTKFLGETAFLTQRLMASYNRSASSRLSQRESQDRGFFLKSNYNNFRNSTLKKKTFLLQKTSAPDFFHKARNFDELNDDESIENDKSEPYIFKSRVRQVQGAIQDLKRIREEFQIEKMMLELEKQGKTTYPSSQRGLYSDLQKMKTPTINNTPINTRLFASPIPGVEYEDKMRDYVNFLEAENNSLKQKRYEEEVEMNRIRETLRDFKEKQRIFPQTGNNFGGIMSNNNGFPNEFANNNNGYLRNEFPAAFNNTGRTSTFINDFDKPIEPKLNSSINIEKRVSKDKIIMEKGTENQKKANEKQNMQNNEKNNKEDNKMDQYKGSITNLDDISPISETIIRKTSENLNVMEQEAKKLGKYATRASRNFKLNLENLNKGEDADDKPEVQQRKNARYKDGPTEPQTNATNNTIVNRPASNSRQLPKPKLSRAAASLEIKNAMEKNLNSSKNSIPSITKLEDMASEEILEFFGIQSKEKFTQSFGIIFSENENSAHNEVFKIKSQPVNGKIFRKEFRFLKVQEEMNLRIELKEISENEKTSWSLEMNMKSLLELVRTFEMRDVFSTYCSVKNIQSREDFLKLCVVPFTSIRGHGKGEFGLAFIDKPEGILSKQITLSFFNENYLLNLHYICQNELKAVLTHCQNSSKVIRIDLSFDDIAFSKLFKLIEGKDCKNEEIADIIKISEVFELGEEGQSSPVSTKIFKKYVEKSTEEKIRELDTIEIIDEQILTEKLQSIISFFDEFIRDYIGKKEYEDLNSGKNIVVLRSKIFEEFLKFRVYALLENVGKDILEIFLKNGFDSHAPQKKMVKSKGNATFEIENLWKKFGVLHSCLDAYDRYTVYSVILDSYSVDIFHKELEEDDYDRFDENAISFSQIEFLGFSRTILGDIKKQPLTLTLFGFNSVPKAIRVTIYDPTDRTESGLLLMVNERFWRKNAEQRKEMQAKKKKKYMVMVPMEENYNIYEILKKCGYRILKSKLSIEEREGNFSVTARSLIKDKNYLESLENLLTMGSVLDFYKNYDPDTP